MTTKTYSPCTITQTSTSTSQNWNNLNNIKNSTSSYSQCGSSTIAGKNGTRNKPSVLSFTNFQVDLPTGAEVSKITVEYAHAKVTYRGATPNIPAPTITLLNVSGQSGKGVAPTTTMTANKKTFTFSPDVSKIKNNNFGVKFDYPKNTNTNPGYMRLQYVRIVVTYKAPSFSLAFKKLDKNLTVGDETSVNLTLNNTNKTVYSPNVTIKLPSNVSLQSNNGKVTQSGNTLTWKPSLSKRPSSVTLKLVLKINGVGSGSVVATESLTNANKTLSFTTVAAPVTPVVTEEELEPIQEVVNPNIVPTTIAKNDFFEVTFNKPDVDSSTWNGYGSSTVIYTITESTSGAFKVVNSSGTEQSNYSAEVIKRITKSNFGTDDAVIIRFKAKGEGYNELIANNQISSESIQLPYEIIPASLTTPLLSFIEVTGEELNRLGDQQQYTVGSYVKVVTSTDEPGIVGAIVTDYVRDWGKNFRIGICNAELPSNYTVNDIFTNAEYWSTAITEVETWEYHSVDFIYHEEYPLFIIFTSDYSEGAPDTSYLVYTSPSLIETDVYKGYEETGNYPQPINECILADDFSNLNVPVFASSTPFIVYDFPVEDNIDENTAVMGIQLSLDVDYADELSLTAQLRSSTGKIGERSIIINEAAGSENNTINIGSIYDRWGFNSSDFVDLKDWELIIIVNNLFNNESGTGELVFNNIQVTFFTQEVEDAAIICEVEDEDTRWYGMFLQKANIPLGLETETKYPEIEGVDANKPYRQNINPKTIELEFSIGDCLLEDSTMMFRNLVRLLQTKRDSLDQPILKKIWFSHMPDIYFEYILEDSIDSDINITDYEGKLKLTIPSGTAYSLEDTVTNVSGSVVGMAKVPCRIVIIPLSDTIAIEEEHSGDKFSITYNDWDSTHLVEIDTQNHTILLKDNEDDIDPTDITEAGDFNNDWFQLHGDYTFKATNCILQSVTYNERW